MYFIKEHVITQIQKDYGYTRKQALDFYDRIDDECRAEFDAEYYAEENEAVWDISKKYKKDPQYLMKINGLTEDILKQQTMLRL